MIADIVTFVFVSGRILTWKPFPIGGVVNVIRCGSVISFLIYMLTTPVSPTELISLARELRFV